MLICTLRPRVTKAAGFRDDVFLTSCWSDVIAPYCGQLPDGASDLLLGHNDRGEEPSAHAAGCVCFVFQ